MRESRTSGSLEGRILQKVRLLDPAKMIDRLVHHGHLILFEGNSYRMEHALMKQTARQPGAGAESKDSTLNAKRSGSL